MTIQEAINQLEYERALCLFNPITGEQTTPERFKEFYDEEERKTRIATKMALEALKELQQYRNIGTVEECREAVERDRAKEPVIRKEKYSDGYYCPKCDYVFIHKDETGWFCGQHLKVCPVCGQAIQWCTERAVEGQNNGKSYND